MLSLRGAAGKAGTVAPTAERIREGLVVVSGTKPSSRDFCYTYPETSANLQSYIKSRFCNCLVSVPHIRAGPVHLSSLFCTEIAAWKNLYGGHGSVLDAGSSRLGAEGDGD